MRVLITGSGGFLGRYVVNEIVSSYPNITPLLLSDHPDSRFHSISPLGYAFSPEYLVENGCSDIDAVIHMGAYTPKSGEEANDISGCTSNITGTQALLSSDLPTMRKFIYLSTLDVYGSVAEEISENTPCTPQSLYGVSKLYCEKMIAKHCKLHGITYQILRIGHVFGAGEEVYRKVMPVMIENALKGESLKIYGDGSTLRTYIYAKDVANAILLSLGLTDSNIVNIVGDRAISLLELAKLIIRLSESNSEIEFLPATGSEHDITFDASLMKKLLPIDLTSLEEGLQQEIGNMRNKYFVFKYML